MSDTAARQPGATGNRAYIPGEETPEMMNQTSPVTLADVQALADSAAFSADELLAKICQPIAQHVLPKDGFDGAFAGSVV